MDTHEVVDHLVVAHNFDAITAADAAFMRGVHHGLHVEAGRHGAEGHLHAVENQQIPPGGGTVQWQE